MQGQKENLSQRVQELCAIMALQEQGRKFFTRWCEEKLSQNRELLPGLREVMQEDMQALDIVQKLERALSCPQRKKLAVAEVCAAREHSDMAFTSRTAEVVTGSIWRAQAARRVLVFLLNLSMQAAQEELQAELHDQVKMCDLLLSQVRQRSQVRDALQRWLQQLQGAELDDNQHQVQVIRQVENDIEKMLVKGRAGEKVTTLYLGVWDVLRKELAHLPSHLDLLCGMAKLYHGELEFMELMAFDTLRTTHITKEDMAKVQAQFLKERELRFHSLASEKVPIDRAWLKEARERMAVSGGMARAGLRGRGQCQASHGDADTKATRMQTEYEAWVTQEVERAKAVVQCSCLWDIPSRLLAQQKSSVDLEQFIKGCKEKKQELKETLKELELKLAELKFGQPPNTTSCRKLEEEVRMNLQREEARLEQLQAQMLMNQELLLEYENGINYLTARLRGIAVPNQDDSAKAVAVEEKLQHCQQKLQYLLQRVADLPPHTHSPEEDNETFAKVRNLLEKTTTNDPRNLKISLKEAVSSIQGFATRSVGCHWPSKLCFLFMGTRAPQRWFHRPCQACSSPLSSPDFTFADKGHGLVPTREYIKKQGLQLIERKKKSAKK
ncbi:coiled-coil domain-containing protein 183 [Pogoniulus pusillus]|uniref:coiled-coil domain-containing protein 183 n=1 Tax=Pogoniulus pusillus TaxID=488313 RepID=UPI0030B960B6